MPAIKVLQRLPGRRLFLYQDAEQVRAIRIRDVNAFLCDVASCKVSLKDFRTLRASVNVVETLARTERGESQTRRKRQVKQAIQIAADDLANTVTICRKSYVHEAVIEAFEQGKLNGKAKSSNGRPAPARRVLAEVVNAHAAGNARSRTFFRISLTRTALPCERGTSPDALMTTSQLTPRRALIWPTMSLAV